MGLTSPPHAALWHDPGALVLCLALFAGGTAAASEPATTSTRNHLAAETSPYLLQHAANPVDWYPWGEEAFDKARREGKFIFLSVGYSTCYWCHVMERESFSDPEVAALLNRYAVSIKVDREERPDVDEIYMTAVQLMAGHGGWPMNLLLTPDLKPFFGATYLPRNRLMGLITEAQSLWTDNQPAVKAQGRIVADAIRQATGLTGKPLDRLPDAALPDQAVAAYAKVFDPFQGGFGPAPKFPRPSILELLLTHHQQTGDTKSLEMVTTSLDAMARGGIHDQVGGGFHRYATDNEWLVPHFEKMLYDNAQLLHVYARAHALTGNPLYRRVAEGIAAYVERVMTGDDGLFHSAQDSEVDGEEGHTYLWTPEELQQALPAAEYDLARRVWGMTGAPNFEGEYVLHWPRDYAATAAGEGLSTAALMARLEPIRARLLAARDKRPQPRLDDKAVTAWNAQMIWALAYAGEVLDEPAYVRRAERAAAALLATLRGANGGLLHVARHGRAKLDAYLDDHAATILALMELHRVTGDAPWRTAAVELADAMIANFRDPAGGFFDTPPTVEHLLARTRSTDDGAVPSGNSLAVRALVVLGRKVDARYGGQAAATLRAFGPLLAKAPGDMPHMLWGLADYRRAGLAEDAAPATVPRTGTTADHTRAGVRFDGADPHRMVVTLHLADGWHVNAAPASLAFLIPTRVHARAAGRDLALAADYPAGEPLKTNLETPIAVYHDGVRIPARFTEVPPPDVEVMVEVQACSDDGRCLPPAEIRATREPSPE